MLLDSVPPSFQDEICVRGEGITSFPPLQEPRRYSVAIASFLVLETLLRTNPDDLPKGVHFFLELNVRNVGT